MAHQIVVAHIADDTVNVLHVRKAKGVFWVEEAHTLDQKEFDQFLTRATAGDYIVTAGFQDSFADVITIPAVKEKYERAIIEGEIRMRFKRTEFEYVYAVIGDKTIDRKRMKEIFAFAVDRAAINAIIDRFLAHGKTVKALYPDMFAVARLTGKEDEAVLCIMQSGSNKNLFLVTEGAVSFVRVTQAFDNGIGELDIQNILMTVNYCRQAMKANIKRVHVIGKLCEKYSAHTQTPVPMTSFVHPVLCRPVKGVTLSPDFIFPVSALACMPEMQINMVPRESRTMFLTARVLRLMIVMLAMIGAFAILQAGFAAREVLDLQRNIDVLRKNMTGVSGVVDRYHSKQAAFERYRPFVDSYRKCAQLPDFAGLMQQLSAAAVENISIDSISVRYSLPDTAGSPAERRGAEVKLSGLVRADSYTQIQNFYQRFVSSIKGLKSMELEQQSLDLESKKYQVTLRYE